MTTDEWGRVGVTNGVWANDQINRLERILFELAAAPLTLYELERFERALVKAHERNIDRVKGLGDEP